MAIIFPTTPNQNQIFTSGGKSWIWTGTRWEIVVVDPSSLTAVYESISSGDASTLASAENYTDSALQNFTTLPDQTNKSGQYLTTDGTNASWSVLSLDKNISDLSGVAIVSPADGEALVYDSATNKWINSSVSVDLSSYATQTYVNNAVANLVDSAPSTLDTLNELAAALSDDPSFATTITNSIASKADAQHTHQISDINNLSSQLDAKADKLIQFNQQSGTTYSLTISDLDKLVELNNSAAITLTVPEDSSVNFPVGASISILQSGVGQVTVSPAQGVTINATPSLLLRTQWSSATLVKRSANTWLLSGDLD